MPRYIIPLTNGVTIIPTDKVWEAHHITLIPPPGSTGTITIRAKTADGAAFEFIPNGTIDLESFESFRFIGPVAEFEITQTNITSSGNLVIVHNADGLVVEGRGYSSYRDGVREGAYNGTEPLVAITSVEMNIRRGQQYIWTFERNLTNNEVVNIGFVADLATPSIIKTRDLTTNGGVIYQAYGGADYTTLPGNEIPNANLNGLSADESGLKVYEVPPGDVTSLGTKLPGGIIKTTNGQGSNREQGIFSNVGIERILPPGTRNMVTITNRENKEVFIVLDITWYEGPVTPGPDNPKP